MIEINLLPEEFRRKERVKLVLPDVPIKKTLLIFSAVVALIVVPITLFSFYQKFEMRSTKAALDKIKSENKELMRQKTEIVVMEARLKQTAAIGQKKFNWWQMLNALSDSMVKGIWLTSLGIEDYSDPAKAGKAPSKAPKTVCLKIEGSAVAQGQEAAAVGRFITSLKSHPYLADLFDTFEMTNMTQKKIKEYDVYDFIVVCSFKKGKMS